MKSKRQDKKGHWPKGKRRNKDAGHWSRTRLSAVRLIDDHFLVGSISYRALAAVLSVSDRTVHRWLSGEDRPDAEIQAAIEQWIKENR